MDINQLNDDFAISTQLTFSQQGDFPLINVNNAYAEAVISVYGGQVLAYRPKPQASDLLFVSTQAYHEVGQPIQGGIPVCWPWFGVDPGENRGRPLHGFARQHFWIVRETAAESDGTHIELELTDSAATRALWPHAFRLVLRIHIGATLRLALTSHNTGTQPFQVTQALHSYFAVGSITEVSVSGLEATDYTDHAVDGNKAVKHQQGRVTVTSEVNRVYQNVPAELMLTDAHWGRRIYIHAMGSHSAVVWNPGPTVIKNMADLADDDYLHFICIETANAGDDSVEVAAGEQYTLGVELSTG